MIKPFSTLLYGGPGAGKTFTALTSFWDFDKGTAREGRNGLWIQVGRENNPALDLPDQCIRRFAPDLDNPTKFVTELAKYCRSLVKEVRQGKTSYYAIVFDGFSEWQTAYQLDLPDSESGEGRKFWGEVKRELISILQILNPDELKAHVLATARITELKKATATRSGKETPGDPSWMNDFKYYPSMDGWARHNLGHYFNLVCYVDQDTASTMNEKKQLVRQSQHKVWFMADGDFWVKNVWEHGWGGKPHYLVNPTFDDIVRLLEGGKVEQADK